jgi:hypothetical protein
MSQTVPKLFALFKTDEVLRGLVGERMFQNQATEEANDPETGRAGTFLVLTRRDAARADVLKGSERSTDPDEEFFDLDAATVGDPEQAEQIVERVTALLHDETKWASLHRTPQFVEVTDVDEGYTPREDLVAQGFDVANCRIGIYY